MKETVYFRVRGNVLRLCQEQFRLSIRKILFTKRVARHWNRHSRDTVESSSLQVLKKHVDVALGDMA